MLKPSHHIQKQLLVFYCILLLPTAYCLATTRTSVSSGNWNVANTWSPCGAPTAMDNVVIASGHTVTVKTNESVKNVTINSGGLLTWSNANTLTLTGNLTVNGNVVMNGGNILFSRYGLLFNLGANASFTWDPGTNTAAGATLFTNGIESFAPTSTLIIKKWYSYSVALGSVVTGNFGNLELNSLNGNSVYEWNQNNQFQTHLILGTLTIDQGWITLDKSGTLLNTMIGGIVLKNANSSFYGHNGTHPSSFTVTTSSVINNGGNFYGLSDGNGDITVHVTGSFTNSGNVKILNNSGVSGVSNGNAMFMVDSTFLQTSGDTRVIYNVSTTNSGLYTASFRNLNLNGGIFMGQTGCRTAGGICSLTILQNLTINFSNPTDKFRGTSLSSIGQNMNNVQFNLTVGGNISISGNTSSEVTSAASAGTESIQINGNTIIQGGNVSFNYGASNAAHQHSVLANGNVTINGGTVFLSRNNGLANISINGNFLLSSGTCSVKAADSLTVLNINGNFSQTGGTFYLHNSNTVALSPANMNISGDFSQSAGTFSFETLASNFSPTNTLSVSGTNFTLSGNGVITHAGAGTCTVFGLIDFNKQGTINFSRNGSNHLINQVKQVVKNNCTVKIINGNLEVASNAISFNDYLKIETGGTLSMGNGQVSSNGLFANSGIQIDSSATISTQRTAGFFDSTSACCINVANNLAFILHPYSIVEYNGLTNQTLTSNGSNNVIPQHQYGILKINTFGSQSKVLLSNSVIVRTGLLLANGELNLNGNTLCINNGASSAITRTNGYVNGELNNQNQSGKILWKNMTLAPHELPFGTDATSYVPVLFTPTTGSGKDVSVSTYSTATDNTPYPTISNGSVNFSLFGDNYAVNNLIDRWWNISATGVTANITVSYRSAENSLPSGTRECTLNMMLWNGSSWDINPSTAYGVLTGVGTANISNVSSFSLIALGHFALGVSCRTVPATFEAELISDKVSLKWTIPSETTDELFIVERSSDDTNFEEISRKTSVGNSTAALNYSTIDESPLQGISYYRLKEIDSKGNISYSEMRKIVNDAQTVNNLTIEQYGPNPFSENFRINYKISGEGTVNFQLSNSNGQLISQSQSIESKGSHRFEYNQGSALQPGIYILKIIFNDKVVMQKLIKK